MSKTEDLPSALTRLADLASTAADEIERLRAERATLNVMRHTLIRLVHEVREANAAASDGQTFRLLTRRQELAWQALVDACCRAGGQDASAATTPPPDHADVDILAAYSRDDGRREWVSVGTWLRPGEVVAHMDDPRPQQASGATTGYASGTAT